MLALGFSYLVWKKVIVGGKEWVQEIWGLSCIFVSVVRFDRGSDEKPREDPSSFGDHLTAYPVTTKMPRQVLCECCNEMVTPFVAKKHREAKDRERYFESLGHDPIHAADPIPPITAESLFGPISPPMPAEFGGDMNIDEETLPPEPLPPPIITSPDLHPPSCHRLVLDDDFEPDDDSNDGLAPPEEYDEDLERSAREEEQQADEDSGQFPSEEHQNLEEIEYGELQVVTNHTNRCLLPYTEGDLHEYDIAICKAFAWFIRSGVSKRMFSAIPQELSGFVNHDLPSAYVLRARAKELAGIEPVRYDCCVNSHICFTGHYSSLDKCTHCNEPRFSGHDSHGKPHPRQQFLYIPVIPRLRAFIESVHMAKLMRYRSTRTHTRCLL